MLKRTEKFMESFFFLDGTDYLGRSQVFTFSPSNMNQPLCLRFRIADDNLVEDRERFGATLNPAENETSIQFSPRETSVTILDNDCEFKNHRLY